MRRSTFSLSPLCASALVGVSIALGGCGGGSTASIMQAVVSPGPNPSPSPSPAILLHTIPSAGLPLGIVNGSDGNVWFADDLNTNANTVSRVNIATGQITEYTLPQCAYAPEYLALGSDNNLWVSAECVRTHPNHQYAEMAVVTPSGTTTLIPMRTARSSGFHETLGPDGNIWFTLQGVGQIGKITPSGIPTYYSLHTRLNPTPRPSGIAVGPDGNLWVAGLGLFIDKVDTGGNILGEYPMTVASDGIVAGPDGNMWFTDAEGDHIGTISLTGQVHVMAVTNFCAFGVGKVGPLNIIAASDGTLWMTDIYADGLAQVTPTFQITPYCLPSTPSGPFDLAQGRDGNIWFTFPGYNAIGEIVVTHSIMGQKPHDVDLETKPKPGDANLSGLHKVAQMAFRSPGVRISRLR
jgi:streptogramin lyase